MWRYKKKSTAFYLFNPKATFTVFFNDKLTGFEYIIYQDLAAELFYTVADALNLGSIPIYTVINSADIA
jgi:hypothetical protein